ncbi:MAG: right-handed parallel beta-helix repeat-containing protein, partial [Vicinamibacterales bacterium]
DNRTRTDICAATGFDGSNVWTSGVGYVFHHVDTINAMCGSGLEATGANYEIYSVYAADNGTESPGPWADGITLTECNGGTVTNNVIVNNTDVGLVVFTGTNCTVRFNEIRNDDLYAFAGFKLGDPGPALIATLAGGRFTDNTIISGYNLLSFGIMIGNHPWNADSFIEDVGEVRYNTVAGSVVNLAIDGIGAGFIADNALSNAQGDRDFGPCRFTGNYTYGHSPDPGGGAVCQIFHSPCGCQ